MKIKKQKVVETRVRAEAAKASIRYHRRGAAEYGQGPVLDLERCSEERSRNVQND